MKRHSIVLAMGLSIAGGANAAMDKAGAEALMKKSGCDGCHEVDKKVVGPAFRDVAAKYKGDGDAPAKLRDKVKKGGVHVWGEAAMPPNVLATDADIQQLVDWILSLQK
jgi:cytochrome c